MPIQRGQRPFGCRAFDPPAIRSARFVGTGRVEALAAIPRPVLDVQSTSRTQLCRVGYRKSRRSLACLFAGPRAADRLAKIRAESSVRVCAGSDAVRGNKNAGINRPRQTHMIAGAPSRMARDSTGTVLASKSGSLRTAVPTRAARQLEQDSCAKRDGERPAATSCEAGAP